jgi:hypothetical protein
MIYIDMYHLFRDVTIQHAIVSRLWNLVLVK